MKQINYLIEIAKLCQYSVSVSINGHRDSHKTAAQALQDMQAWETPITNIGEAVIAKMVELDTIIHIQAYPATAIGFYQIYHYDLREALKLIYEALKKDL